MTAAAASWLPPRSIALNVTVYVRRARGFHVQTWLTPCLTHPSASVATVRPLASVTVALTFTVGLKASRTV